MPFFSLPEQGYKRVLVLFAYALIAFCCLFLFVKFLLPILLPFLLAWVLARLLQPLMAFALRTARLPRKVVALLFILLFTALAGGLSFLFVSRIVREIRSFLSYLTAHSDGILSSFLDFADGITARLPLSFGIDTDTVIAAAAELLTTTLAGITTALPGMVMTVVKAVPGILFFLFVILFSSYYLCADFSEINSALLLMLPSSFRRPVRDIGHHLKSTLVKYLRAYLLIMFITFSELLVGFLILRMDYAFTLALIVSFIDIFPVLGVGTVLLPMAALKIIGGDLYTGIGLIIVFAIVQIVRQFAEPRVVGITLGMYPLLTVLAMYAGLKLMGVPGLLIFPPLAMLLCSLLRRENRENTAPHIARDRGKG